MVYINIQKYRNTKNAKSCFHFKKYLFKFKIRNDCFFRSTSYNNKKKKRNIIINGNTFPINSAISHSICRDKVSLSNILCLNSVPCVKHFIAYKPFLKKTSIKRIKNKLNQNALVIKPLNGSKAKNVYKIKNIYDYFLKIKNMENAFAVSKYYELKCEYRLIIFNNKLFFIYKKISDNFYFNLSLGAKAKIEENKKLTRFLFKLALKAVKAVGINFCSVDIVKTIENRYLILEINSTVFMDNFLKQNPKQFKNAKKMYEKILLKL